MTINVKEKVYIFEVNKYDLFYMIFQYFVNLNIWTLCWNSLSLPSVENSIVLNKSLFIRSLNIYQNKEINHPSEKNCEIIFCCENFRYNIFPQNCYFKTIYSINWFKIIYFIVINWIKSLFIDTTKYSFVWIN